MQIKTYCSPDPRTADWPLVGSLVPVVIIIVSYLYFVTKCGPDYMRERKPYDLKKLITVYNIGQIAACIFVMVEVRKIISEMLFKKIKLFQLLASGWYNDLSLGCEPVDFSNSPKALRMARATWWTLILKLSEFLETVSQKCEKHSN